MEAALQYGALGILAMMIYFSARIANEVLKRIGAIVEKSFLSLINSVDKLTHVISESHMEAKINHITIIRELRKRNKP